MDRLSWEECIIRLGGLTPILGNEFDPLDEAELTAFELELGVRLPEDYRRFLATYGASTFRCLTSIRAAGPIPKILSDDGLLPFGLFYGANRLAHDFPSLRFCVAQFRDDINAEFLPIADANSDDQICIGIAGKRRGMIYYWDSEGAEDEPNDNGSEAALLHTYFVADSFADLLNRIEPFSEESPNE